jgi:hypothetical protein
MQNRRLFIKNMALLAAALKISNTSLAENATTSTCLYLNESNNFPGYKAVPFVFGILQSTNHLVSENKIKEFRKKLHYNCE